MGGISERSSIARTALLFSLKLFQGAAAASGSELEHVMTDGSTQRTP